MANQDIFKNPNLQAALAKELGGQDISTPQVSQATNQGAPMAQMASKGSSGLIMKIALGLVFVLVLGVTAGGYLLFSSLSAEDTGIHKLISDHDAVSVEQNKRLDDIEVNLSNVDTFDQKLNALNDKLSNFVAKEDVASIQMFLKLQDTDGDGITDFDEVTLYNSDPLLEDTDKDGFTDKEEVDSGYNPSGPGKLEQAKLSDADKVLITGGWTGDVISEVDRSENVSLNLTDKNKVTGSFSFIDKNKKSFQSTVDGSFIYISDTKRFDALLVNSFKVVNSSGKVENEAVEYKMTLSGTFSPQAKNIIGTWEITGNIPPFWTAGRLGTFQFQKSLSNDGSNLDGNNDNDPTTPVAKTISLKAFSFGFLPSTISLKKGERVILEITSLDIDHTFTIDELGIDINVSGGKTVEFEYSPSTTGEFTYYSKVSDDRTKGMTGKITIQ